MRDWYKKAIIYSLDVESFRDGNGDGIGDFLGLKNSLAYLSSLGINCLWLLPFYDTPNKDNGYDVRDYFTIQERLGDLGSFTEFMGLASEFNIKVLIDLVVNHTSDQHHWFKEALKGPDNPFFDYYIWTDKIPEDFEAEEAFVEEQSGNWEYVESLGKYYYHTFYGFQPELNMANPKVREEIKRIMHFWLNQGIAGFRMDAVTFIAKKKFKSQVFDKSPHDIIREFRDYIETFSPYSILLAEADVEPEKYSEYFLEGEGMHTLFNFYANNYLFYSLAIGKAAPLVNSYKPISTPKSSDVYANFIRNHDELNLIRLKPDEMQTVFDCFAKDENMRIYGRGIRRRFQPMVNGDRKMLELTYSLLLSLPGIPVIRYGEEIGMGDDLSLPGRESVRTVMQWSDARNAGFSTAPKEQLARTVIEEGPYSYEKINVNKQLRDRNSFLYWVSMGITARRRCPEFGTGEFEFLETNDDEVMMHVCRSSDSLVIAIHNFGNEKKKVKLLIEKNTIEGLIDIFGDQAYPDLAGTDMTVEINPKGYRWFRTGF